MTTTKRATAVQPQRPVGYSMAQAIASKQSMLDGPLPGDYSAIETTGEALAAAYPPVIAVRIHIVWDNRLSTLSLDRVLEHMRETGAAAVVKVEGLG